VTLETWDTPDQLYSARREEINPLRPLFTGDVFTGVPQLFAPLVHICTESPCSERFGLVRTSKRHRYTFRV